MNRSRHRSRSARHRPNGCARCCFTSSGPTRSSCIGPYPPGGCSRSCRPVSEPTFSTAIPRTRKRFQLGRPHPLPDAPIRLRPLAGRPLARLVHRDQRKALFGRWRRTARCRFSFPRCRSRPSRRGRADSGSAPLQLGAERRAYRHRGRRVRGRAPLARSAGSAYAHEGPYWRADRQPDASRALLDRALGSAHVTTGQPRTDNCALAQRTPAMAAA